MSESIAAIVARHAGGGSIAETIEATYARIVEHADPALFIALRPKEDALALALGKAAVASVMLGVMLAILHYEWVHYVAHIPHTPLTRAGRGMKTYHLRHHFVSEKEWFGVSNPALDLVFGAFKDPKSVKKSATTTHLHP